MSQCTIAGRRSCRRWLKLEAQRPAGQVHLARDLDQAAQRDALQRDRMTAAQRVQVDAVAVVGGDHGQAGEPAFRRLGLQDHRQAPAAAELQKACASRSHPRAEQRIEQPAHQRAAVRG